MGPKKKMMSIEVKREIIQKHEEGVRVIDLARMHGRSTSMICTVLKQKDLIKGITPAKGVTIMSKLRTSLHEKMEKLLMAWVTEKQLKGGTGLTQKIICKKARAIYRELLKQIPHTSTSGESADSFKASRGWYDNFKKRTGIHTVVKHGESARCDVKEARDYIKTFSELIAAKGYTPQQVFNCGETGLFWKRIPNRTYTTGEEKTMTGNKPMKDRLTVALCANARGDCKIKPLVVYHSENDTAFNSHRISKEKLQVMWRANPTEGVTRQLFVEWINLVFGPSVKKYLEENKLPMQVLLVLDNAPAHAANLEDDLLEEFKFINVLYLPAKITPILQPMDQQVIPNFKKLYTEHILQRRLEVTEETNFTVRKFWKNHCNIVICLRIIDQAWLGVTTGILTSAWKKLWPEAAAETEVLLEVENGSLRKSGGLEVNEREKNELVKGRPAQEPTTEELHDLRGINFQEKPKKEEVIATRDIKKILGMWEKVAEFVDKNHPENVATSRASELFNKTCIIHFRNILKERTKKPTSNSISKRPAGENEQSVTKKAKTGNEN